MMRMIAICVLPSLVAAGLAFVFAEPTPIVLGAGIALPLAIIAAWLEGRGVHGTPMQALQGIVVAMLFRLFAVLGIFIAVRFIQPEWLMAVLLTVAVCLVVTLFASIKSLMHAAQSTSQPADSTQ